MAVVIIPDLLRESQYRIGPNSVKLYRSFYVGGINTTVDNYLPTAVAELASVGVFYGAPEASNPTLVAQEFQGIPLSPTQALIVVCFENLEFQGTPYLFEFDSSLQEDQTNYDVRFPNIPLQVIYWDNPADVGNKVGAGVSRRFQGATVPVLKPYTTLNISFYYTQTVQDDPVVQEWRDAVGYVNTDTFFGWDPQTVLCTNVKTNQSGTSLQVKVQCQFSYKPQTWLAWASYRAGSIWPQHSHKNPNDPNQTVAGAAGSNGWAGFLPYPVLAFGTTFPFGS